MRPLDKGNYRCQKCKRRFIVPIKRRCPKCGSKRYKKMVQKEEISE